MNILPLILALVLMLSVLTIERLEKFKNQSIIQREYQVFLKENERVVFNQRQKKLFEKKANKSGQSIRQLSFRYFIDKKVRDRDQNVAKQYRVLAIELMKILYGEAAFFKKIERKRPNFLEEMLTAIEQAAEATPKKLIKRIQDIARLDLDDPELQEAFYHMLKGTITRDELNSMEEEIPKKKEKFKRSISESKGMAKELTPRMKKKAYVSLFTFINDVGADKAPKIRVALAPREILKTIFLKDEVVDEILTRRSELGKKEDSGAQAIFKSEFISKVRTGIDENLLDFKLSENSAKYD